MSPYPKLVIIGYTNIDINITPKSQSTLPGGAAYFVACAASLLTANVGLVTRIGYDFDPTFLLTRVVKDGVHIIPDKETAKSIQTYFSLTDPTDRDVVLKKGVAQDLNPNDIPEGWLENAEIIHVGTMPPEYQKVFIEYVKENKGENTLLSTDTELSFVKNPRMRKQIVKNMSYPDMVFVNRLEYELLKKELSHIRHVIVKLDKDGAVYLYEGKEECRVTTKNTEAVDSTGAGDVFAGTFLAARVNGDSFETALKKAADKATNSIEKEGVMHLFEE
jgi:sugar/nucleoside kinase (ribokinase family)